MKPWFEGRWAIRIEDNDEASILDGLRGSEPVTIWDLSQLHDGIAKALLAAGKVCMWPGRGEWVQP